MRACVHHGSNGARRTALSLKLTMPGAVAYRRKHPTVAAALGCGALTAAALYCLYWVVAVALFLHEGLDLPSQ